MILRGPRNVSSQRFESRHGGEGECTVRTLFEDEFGSSFKHVRELTLHEGATIGEHLHVGDEEIYYIIEGEAVVTVDAEERIVAPGDCILVQSGSCHGLKSLGKDMVRILVACARI